MNNTVKLFRPGYRAVTDRFYSIATSNNVVSPLNFVNGSRVESSNNNDQDSFELQNPATGEVLKQVKNSNSKDVNEAVECARAAFKTWSTTPAFERGQVLKKAADILRRRLEEFAQIETLDNGKPIWESRFDMQGCADTIEYYGGIAARQVGEYIPVGGGSFAYTIREPLGVVGGIGAWNYPIQMASWKSAPALACGNTFVLKPSQFTPLTAVMMGEVYKEAGLPDGCYNVIQGEGETGGLLCNHPDVDKMSFTGSVPTGTKIMEACSKGIKHITLELGGKSPLIIFDDCHTDNAGIKHITLELGGKSPLIIFDDCHIDNAVTGAMLANFLTQGQVCSNGTRVFVQKKILDEFLEKLVDRTKKMKIGDPFAEDTTVGATISKQQADKVLNYIDIGKKEGAEILCGGERVIPEPRFSGGQFISPCVMSGCHDNMTVVKEEIFGPVLSVLVFDCDDEAIERANNTEFGLAGGVFTRNNFISPCVMSGCHDDMTVVKEEIFGPVLSVLVFDCDDEAIERANNTEFGLAGGVFTRKYFISPCIMSGCHDDMTVVKEEIFGPVLSVLVFDCDDEAIERANNTEFGLAGGVFTRKQFISPCVMSGCHDDMTVVKEEIFGPVLSVLVFDCEDEAIERANNTEFGLAGGVFTKDLKRAHRVASLLQAGSLYVNNYNLNPVGVPFGGYKKSGIGRENGPDTLNYYSQIKSVYVEMNDPEAPF